MWIPVDCSSILNGFAGLAASMNPAIKSTLRKLEFEFKLVRHNMEDPFGGISAELGQFKPLEIDQFEEIIVRIHARSHFVNIGNRWCTLDDVLDTTKFPKLKRVSVNITILTFYRTWDEFKFEEEIVRLIKVQFPKLSASSTVSFNLSAKSVATRDIK